MRGRLFRERVPGAYGILTRPDPPVLARVPSNVTSDEAIRIMATVLTTGEERFNQAEALARGQDRGGHPALRTALRGMPHLLDRPGRPGAPEEAPDTGSGTIAKRSLTGGVSVRPRREARGRLLA
jgi:hypothetical protein